ncbi:MAG: Ig-like domain-containing protein, partial [Saprospiraceae bacterium]
MISILHNYCKFLLCLGFHFALIFWMVGCASTGNPTGGPRDLLPPVLDTLSSSLDRQTNVKPKELIFLFDEFVEVRDPIKQVLVSPPLTYIPKVTHRGKKVTFVFDEKEVLRDDATYTINFGEAIVDFHEGNKLENFTYVFATGDQLDSLNLKGNIFDALTNTPDENMVIFLYDNLQDSAVSLERPFYFARPDKSGNFAFRNIKSDTFRIFAIKDENINYIYDLETEKIAFYDTLVVLTDTFKQSIQLRTSLPTPNLKIKSVNAKTYGKINILCNTVPGPDLI